MAHRAARTGYQSLVRRLNKAPQGAPPSELLYEILKILMSEREASLVALVPIRPFTAKTAARAWKMTPADAQAAVQDVDAYFRRIAEWYANELPRPDPEQFDLTLA